MRVITGTVRGRKLIAPQGLDTRPTTDLVKEAIFSIIQFDVPGVRVLDLFAGSGQMGVEALSRGAESVVFVDGTKAAIAAIKQNISTCGFEEQSRVVQMDAMLYLESCGDRFGLAFLDPPYHENLLQKTLPWVAKRMAPGGIILCETARDEQTPEQVGGFVRAKQYRYGRVMVHLYRDGREEA